MGLLPYAVRHIARRVTGLKVARQGVLAAEMQAASLFAFAAALKVNVNSCLLTWSSPYKNEREFAAA
jgi:hypothetical protein